MCRASYTVAQHFLLSPAVCTLTLGEVFRMPEEDAYERFRKLRWPATDGQPVCPDCGNLEHWELIEGHKWKCKAPACRLQFTVTSKTLFASRKLEYRMLLAAIALFANGVLGVSALRLRRELGIAYKTAFVLLHKIRESMTAEYDEPLEGVVEIDGAYLGTRRYRLPNKRIDGDEAWEAFKKRNPKKQTTIVVTRERPHEDETRKPKVRAFHVPNEGDAIPLMRKIVKKGTVVHADCGTQWEPLHMSYDTKRINHSECYSDGIACTNWAESFFSRLRCGERGVYRYFTAKYAEHYGWEMAWREENRRQDNGAQISMIVANSLGSRTSSLTGYWQRHRAANANNPFGALVA
jgi:transposase-like protein